MNKKELLSLAPTSDFEDIENYREYLDNVFSLKDSENSLKYRNKNIAISGSYCSGKSSLIKTYFKDNDNVVNVTYGSYNNRDIDTNSVENSILQQIIYYKRPEELPLSRVKRVDKDNKNMKRFDYIFTIILTLIVMFNCLINNLDKFNSFVKSFNIFNISKEFTRTGAEPVNKFFKYVYSHSFSINRIFLIIVLSLILYYVLLIIVNKVHSGFSLKRVSFGKGEFQIDENSDSVLTKYVDELIHFFMITDYEYVVFEDLDRLKNKNFIFNKLKEINEIINHSIKDKTIRFIYCLDDSIFKDPEERSKFFDIIVPVVPITSYKTAISVYRELFYNIDDNTLRDLSLYIYRIRMINDLYNEYSIYRDNYSKLSREDERELLYLCAYKILCPYNFNSFMDGEHVLNNLLNPNYKEYIINKNINNEESINVNNVSKRLIIDELNSGEYKLNAFEEHLVEIGVIRTNAVRLMSKYDYKNIISASDEALISDIQTNGEVGYETKFDNVKESFNELTKYDFVNDSVCNYSLFNELFKRDNKNDYLDFYFNNLTNKKVDYYINYSKTNEEFIKNTTSYLNHIWDYVCVQDISEDDIKYLIYITLKYAKPEDIKNDSSFYRYVSTINGIDTYLNDYAYNLDGRFDLEFNQEVFDSDNAGFLRWVYDNKYFKYNINLVDYICLDNGWYFNKNEIIKSIDSLDNENNIKLFWFNDMNKVYEVIKSSGIEQTDENYVITDYMTPNYVDNKDTFEKLLNVKDMKFDDINDAPIDYYEVMKVKDNIICNWTNINTLFNKENGIDDYIVSLINSNYNELTSEGYKHEYDEVRNELIVNDGINYEAFKVICDSSLMNNSINLMSFDYIKDMDYKRIEYLINNGYLVTSDFDIIMDVLNISSVAYNSKELFVYYSFDLLENNNSNKGTITNDIIDVILSSDIEMIRKINFVSKYSDVFDDGNVASILKLMANKKCDCDIDFVVKILNYRMNILTNEKISLFMLYKNKLEDRKYELSLNIIGKKRQLDNSNKNQKFLQFCDIDYEVDGSNLILNI